MGMTLQNRLLIAFSCCVWVFIFLKLAVSIWKFKLIVRIDNELKTKKNQTLCPSPFPSYNCFYYCLYFICLLFPRLTWYYLYCLIYGSILVRYKEYKYFTVFYVYLYTLLKTSTLILRCCTSDIEPQQFMKKYTFLWQ